MLIVATLELCAMIHACFQYTFSNVFPVFMCAFVY